MPNRHPRRIAPPYRKHTHVICRKRIRPTILHRTHPHLAPAEPIRNIQRLQLHLHPPIPRNLHSLRRHHPAIHHQLNHLRSTSRLQPPPHPPHPSPPLALLLPHPPPPPPP